MNSHRAFSYSRIIAGCLPPHESVSSSRAARAALGLLAEMVNTELPGPARCPVVVIAADGDPLFDLDYTHEVFQRIRAPRKELLIVDSDEHLSFSEALDVVLPAAASRTSPQPGSTGTNPHRLMHHLDRIPPVEAESNYYAKARDSQPAAHT